MVVGVFCSVFIVFSFVLCFCGEIHNMDKPMIGNPQTQVHSRMQEKQKYH